MQERPVSTNCYVCIINVDSRGWSDKVKASIEVSRHQRVAVVSMQTRVIPGRIVAFCALAAYESHSERLIQVQQCRSSMPNLISGPRRTIIICFLAQARTAC